MARGKSPKKVTVTFGRVRSPPKGDSHLLGWRVLTPDTKDDRITVLEIIVIEDEERDCLVVIHAMKLRKQFHNLLQGEPYGL
jgi:hypothetical protein